MRLRLRRNLATQMVAASCALGAVVLAIITGLLVAVNREQAITERVQRAGDSALAATEIRTLVVDMQAGQRGYLLTNQRRFLEPYIAARDRWR